jgi:hypothetical protein
MKSGLALSPGCFDINIGFKVPDADVAHVDKFFADHKAFMAKTHPTSSDAELQPLMYMVTKAPEPKAEVPFQASGPTGQKMYSEYAKPYMTVDPAVALSATKRVGTAGGSSGNTLYSLTATFSGVEACKATMAASTAEGLTGVLSGLVGKYGTFQSMMAEVVHTMKDPLPSALANVKPGCFAFNRGLKVPNADVAKVDALLAEYTVFMEESHFASGNVEPVVLFYTVSKSAEPKDPSDPAAGSTGNTLYALTEIYRGMKGCEAHMAAGQAGFTTYKSWPPPPQEEGTAGRARIELCTPTFLEVFDKYSCHKSIMAKVVHTMK